MATTKRPETVRLSIRLKKNIKRDQVDSLFERLYRISGCLTCGLNGFDLQMISDSVINPVVNQLAEERLDGIAGITERTM